MIHLARAAFDPDGKYRVKRPFTFGSRQYERGEPFKRKTTERQLKVLYRAGFLEHDDAPKTKRPRKAAVPAEA